jgi:hypothetical protein
MSCTPLADREGSISGGRRSEQSHCDWNPAPGAVARFLDGSRGWITRHERPRGPELAAGQQRVLVSHDVGTMPDHFRAFTDAGKYSAGVFLLPQSLDVGAAIDELLLIWLASEAAEWEDRIVWSPL